MEKEPQTDFPIVPYVDGEREIHLHRQNSSVVMYSFPFNSLSRVTYEVNGERGIIWNEHFARSLVSLDWEFVSPNKRRPRVLTLMCSIKWTDLTKKPAGCLAKTN